MDAVPGLLSEVAFYLFDCFGFYFFLPETMLYKSEICNKKYA